MLPTKWKAFDLANVSTFNITPITLLVNYVLLLYNTNKEMLRALFENDTCEDEATIDTTIDTDNGMISYTITYVGCYGNSWQCGVRDDGLVECMISGHHCNIYPEIAGINAGCV